VVAIRIHVLSSSSVNSFLQRNKCRETEPYTSQVGALWKACTHSEPNRNALLANGLRVIEALADEATTAEIQRACSGLLQLLQASRKAQEEEDAAPATSGAAAGVGAGAGAPGAAVAAAASGAAAAAGSGSPAGAAAASGAAAADEEQQLASTPQGQFPSNPEF
jgi:hypothetical protein